MSESVRITGTQFVMVGKRAAFNPAEPEKAQVGHFTLISPNSKGELDDYWPSEGYVQVGIAKVEIELLPRDEMTGNAVSALRKQKDAVIAAAQLEATKIEQQIQSLLAITNEVPA